MADGRLVGCAALAVDPDVGEVGGGGGVDDLLAGIVDVGQPGPVGAEPNHVEMSLDQLGRFRSSPRLAGYRTPLGGLFLTGAGTHPGGESRGCPAATPPLWSWRRSAPGDGCPAGGSAAGSRWSATPPARPCPAALRLNPRDPATGR